MNQQNLPLRVIDQKHKWMVRALVAALLVFPSFIYAQDTQDTQDTQNSQSSQTNADSSQVTDLEVSPNRCVTLRQGQLVLLRARFKWSSSQALAACLYNLDGVEIACWKSSESGSIVLAQTLPNTTEYILVDADGVELNRTSVSVSWVYRKKRSKRRWRLF